MHVTDEGKDVKNDGFVKFLFLTDKERVGGNNCFNAELCPRILTGH